MDEDLHNPHARPWKPVNSTDIWRFIGCLLYMGYNRLENHEKYWSEGGRLRDYMSLIQYD